MRNTRWTVAGLLFCLVLIDNVPAIEWQMKQQRPVLYPLQPMWPPWDHFYRVFLACSGIPFVTRQEWGARPPRDPPKRLRVQPVRLLFVHHTTEDECLDFASCSAKMRYWQDFHMDTRGWDDLGYSFLIGGDGRVYVSRGWDRSGRHTFGYNDVALAVSFMGDFSRRLPSRAALWSLYRLIQCGLAQGKIHPSFTLHGHRDSNCGTTCPGDALYMHIRQWPHYGGRFENRICPPRNETKTPCIPIVSRSQWGARPSRHWRPLLPSGEAQHVYIAHTVGRNCYDLPTCAERMRSYQYYHMEGRKWWDIGYSFVIGGDGRVYQGRGFGVESAHTKGYNRGGISIAFIGDYRNTTPSAKMLAAAQKLIDCGMEQGYISPDYQLHGHRDAICTESPGTALYEIIKSWPHYAGRLDTYICGAPCIPIVSRSQWGARPWRQRRPTHPVQAQRVFIHHTVGPNCFDAATCADRMKSYQNYHMDGRQWWDIGYNFVIGGDGRVYEGRGFGVEGAHTLGHNTDSLGIAFTGDYRHTRPSDKMLAAAQRLIECGVRQGYISPDYELHGHRDARCSESPGTILYEIIKMWPHYAGRLESYICEKPCIRIVSRRQWGARPWRERKLVHPSRPVERIFIAHTVGRNCYDIPTCAARMKSYQDYHMDGHKWADIGYNFVVGGDGRVYEGRGFGVEGTHTLGHNSGSIGIALTGDYRNATPSDKMLDALQRLIDCGVKQGYISPNYQLHGHRDATCTESPGAVLYAIIKTWPHYAGRLKSYTCGNLPRNATGYTVPSRPTEKHMCYFKITPKDRALTLPIRK
ncbi:uncharacterized protein LOC144150119 [Haemaphysalis longicornis]